MVTKTKPRPALDRDAWIHAATEILAIDGVDGVRVEVLAKRCRVTKGSFYWHFKDRRDLLNAMLAHWKEGRIEDVRKHSHAAPGKAPAQLQHMLDVYANNPNRRGILVELAVRHWAQRDARAARVVADVDAARHAYTGDLFLACGLAPQEAASRSLLLYAYSLGESLMIHGRSARGVARLKAWIDKHIIG
jgi:AcrR family transcriptional regulator